VYITIRQQNYENMLYMHGHYDHYKREIAGTVLETSRHPAKYDRGWRKITSGRMARMDSIAE
jgi:hypothetical protein